MLSAVINGKAGRVNLDGESGSVSWRQLYKKTSSRVIIRVLTFQNKIPNGLEAKNA